MRPIHTKELKPGVALITGGAKRIGKEISKNLAYDGWKVIIHYNTNSIAAKNLKNQIIKRKGKAAIIKCDLNNNNSVKDLIEKSKKKFGNISLLINNASKFENDDIKNLNLESCLLYTSPSPRDAHESRMPSSA